MEEEQGSEGRSLADTPTWAVATVITVMVSLGFFFHGSLKRLGKWLNRTKRKSLHAALEKIKEELMLFGLLSLLMGHWIIFVAKICVNSSVLSSKFYPCSWKSEFRSIKHIIDSGPDNLNISVPEELFDPARRDYCPEGQESFASYESLEQLHRFLFVLGITHVSYCFVAVVLAMIKIYSWRSWENQAKLIAIQGLQDNPRAAPNAIRMRRLSTFIFHHTSHPWSQNRVLVWLLCFSRQFWSSINRADYMALRLGFITTHELPLSYNFHNYMLRSMDEEFRDIVGISVPLWIYAIFCIFLDFHGTNAYLWLSFLPAILILLVGTKLHRVVVKLAVDIMHTSPGMGNHQFNLRDELFWFGKPKLLLLLIQLISFQNAFEMATFIWSLWEFREPHCFMDKHSFIVTRLTFGIVSQCWCSFITFPLCVIITQMGSKFKKTVVSENVRRSLHGWQRRVKAKRSSGFQLLGDTSTSSSDSKASEMSYNPNVSSSSMGRSSSTFADASCSLKLASVGQSQTYEPPRDDKFEVPSSGPLYDSFDDDDDDNGHDYYNLSFSTTISS